MALAKDLRIYKDTYELVDKLLALSSSSCSFKAVRLRTEDAGRHIEK